MRRFTIVLLAACLLTTGCRVFDRGGSERSPVGGAPPAGGGSREPFWSEGSGSPGPARELASDAGEPSSDGILAGRLVDAFDRRPNNAFLQVSLIRSDGEAGKPIGVEADQNGYFFIQGLQPGQTYTLRARSEEGERILAGEVQAQPPYTRLLIRLSEDNSPAVLTPAPERSREPAPPETNIPGESDPLFGGGREAPPPASIPSTPDPVPEPDPIPEPAEPVEPTASEDPWLEEHAWEPGPPPPASPVREPSYPRAAPVYPPSAPENIVRNPDYPPPPVAAISGPRDIPSPAFGSPPPRAESPRRTEFGAGVQPRRSRVNFTVYDTRGEPWEFQNHSGKLVLIDFWGTWCTPCLQALPRMKQLASEYGASGLEVIGIAIEDGPWKEVSANVESVQRKYGLNYPVYLEGERSQGDLPDRFNVRSFPTLILLDESGNEVWCGTPDRERELRGILLRRLGQ